MKNVYLLLASLLVFSVAQAQISGPQTSNSPNVNSKGSVDFSVQSNSNQFRASGDSCGAYANNYVGLGKLSVANTELIRTGDISEGGLWGGLAQRYNCPQPMQISGIKFYAYDSCYTCDSIMAIARLHEYNDVLDSLGVELARDTVYVTHQAYSNALDQIGVVAMFDAPVTVADSYMLVVENATNDSMFIVVSAPSNNDGQMEGLAHHYYNNPDYSIYEGSYHNLTELGAAWDYDAIINPIVKYDMHNGFSILDNTICPNIVGAGCVEYTQLPIYADHHYNSTFATPELNVTWTWGDGLQNTQLYNACHTYSAVGSFDIGLSDVVNRYDADDPICSFQSTQTIYVMDSATADFTWANNTTWITFTNTSTMADSVLWNFGDSTFSTSWDTHHVYDTVGTFDVTLIAYGECGNDTITIPVTTDNVGIEEYDFDFNLYPNPANNNVNITGLMEGTRVEILNILGEAVQRTISSGSSLELSTDDLSNGTYFIRVCTDYGQVTKKLLIRH